MKTVWKFPFGIEDHFQIDLPQGAVILHVECQRDLPCIWVLVNPEAPRVTRQFRLVGTGHSFDPHGLIHQGTFQMFSGDLVFHLFSEEL